jgi:GMP synthase-like glutamine amidotransferase
MKLGLLKCDIVTPEFRDIDGGIPDMFQRLLDAAGIAADLRVYRVWEGELPASTGECDGWLTSGSRASVFEDEKWIRNFEEFVRALHADERKTIGICFGHQMIAQALGGETRRSERGWGIGVQPVTILEPQPWMEPPMDSCRLLFTHQDQVEALPEGARLIGSTEHCPNAMFAIGDHILATQAHPEYSRPYLRALIESREAIIDPVTYQAGLATLEQEQHRREMAGWLRNFLQA